MEGCFMFQWGWGVVFQMGGAPWVGTSILVGGGEVSKKIVRCGGGGRPHYGKPWRVVTLKNLLGKGCIWQGEWSHYEVCFSKGCI